MINLLEDILDQLVENAIELKNNSETEMDNGKLLGYYECISIILNRAEAFNISDKLCSRFKNLNVEKLL